MSSKKYLFFCVAICFFLFASLIESNDGHANNHEDKENMNTHIEAEFKEFDSNSDGLIDAQEVRMTRPSVTLQELVQFFWEVDLDSSGTVTLNEYLEFALAQAS